MEDDASLAAQNEVCALIPHRPPFRWVDRIVSHGPGRIETEKTIPHDLDLFAGHFPGYPILPGVLLCEAVAQSGALLLARGMGDAGKPVVPLLTRIINAKFKREVRPGAVIRIEVEQTETVGPAWFFKGKVLVEGKTALKMEFACTIKE